MNTQVFSFLFVFVCMIHERACVWSNIPTEYVPAYPIRHVHVWKVGGHKYCWSHYVVALTLWPAWPYCNVANVFVLAPCSIVGVQCKITVELIAGASVCIFLKTNRTTNELQQKLQNIFTQTNTNIFWGPNTVWAQQKGLAWNIGRREHIFWAKQMSMRFLCNSMYEGLYQRLPRCWWWSGSPR